MGTMKRNTTDRYLSLLGTACLLIGFAVLARQPAGSRPPFPGVIPLPYTDTGNSGSCLFSLTNNGGGPAICGKAGKGQAVTGQNTGKNTQGALGSTSEG